jgi:ABC-type polysaccharide/polyol phosphate export permease
MATAAYAPSGDSRRLRPRDLDLIRITALRSLKVRYRGTTLGVLWSFANPILMTALYATIFGTSFRSHYGGSLVQYVLAAFVGVVVVTFFLQATNEALVSVVANGGLLNKIAIRPETFPLASIAANAFQQCVTTFPVLLIIAVTVTHDPVRVALAPVMLLAVVALTTGFGLTLAALFVFFRDLANVWGLIGFMFWLTSPVFYPAAVVPASVRPFLALNPVGQSITALRDVLLGRGPMDYGVIGTTLVSAALALALGAGIFRALKKDFMDLV